MEESAHNTRTCDRLWELARRPSVDFDGGDDVREYDDEPDSPALQPLKRGSRWRKCAVM